MFNEKWLVNIINDIEWYMDDREDGKVDDDICDHQIWLNLRAAVREEYRSRNFSKPSRYNMVDSLPYLLSIFYSGKVSLQKRTPKARIKFSLCCMIFTRR